MNLILNVDDTTHVRVDDELVNCMTGEVLVVTDIIDDCMIIFKPKPTRWQRLVAWVKRVFNLLLPTGQLRRLKTDD
jgi:hypothetical protein